MPERLEHRPALDGLRGLAVLAVVAYHLSVSPGAGPLALFLPGGFLGVDLFFVLSGFLITSLLLIDHVHRGSTISSRFWIRRARRLLPALLVTLGLTAAYAVAVASPWELDNIRRTGLASLLYVTNWYLIFGDTGPASVLSHTWSLSIEEQWYLLWPFLLGALLYAFRGRAHAVLTAVGALALTSFVAMAVLFDHDGWARAYNGSDTRASELLVGAALALVLLGRRPPAHRAGRVTLEVAGWCGLVVIGWLSFVASPFAGWMYHGGYALTAVGGAALIAAAVQPTSPLLRPALSWRPLAAVGLISYGLYLYQVPVILWLRPEIVGVRGWPLVALRLAVMFALSIASYHLIEMPVRRGAVTLPQARALVPAALLGVMVVLFVATTGGYAIPPTELRSEYYASVAAELTPGADRVLVVGAGDVYDLSEGGVYERNGIGGLAVPLLSCGIVEGRAVAGTAVAPPQTCPDWRTVFASAVEHYRPEVAVLMAGRQVVFDRLVRGTTLRVGTTEFAALLRARLEQAHEVLTARGAQLILPTVPCAAPAPGETGAIGAVLSAPGRRAWVNSVWREFAAAHPRTVTLVDSSAVLCPGGDPNPTVGDGPLRRPDGRLSAAGVAATWDWLAGVAASATGP